MKVLKSFNTAHEAVRWLNNNPIDGTSIEMTHSLKSIGHAGRIPSGNYHVVLKGVTNRLIAGIEKGDLGAIGLAGEATRDMRKLDVAESAASRARGFGPKAGRLREKRLGKLQDAITIALEEREERLRKDTDDTDVQNERMEGIRDDEAERLHGNLMTSIGVRRSIIKSIVEEVVNRVLKSEQLLPSDKPDGGNDGNAEDLEADPVDPKTVEQNRKRLSSEYDWRGLQETNREGLENDPDTMEEILTYLGKLHGIHPNAVSLEDYNDFLDYHQVPH